MQKLLIVVALLMTVNSLEAQIYKSDSLTIEIKYKDHFLVKEYKDLNIDVEYACRTGVSGAYVYEIMLSSYRSTFGSCFFELYRLDSAFGGNKNITMEVIGSSEPPEGMNKSEDPLRYDLKKSFLAYGKKRTLTFNLLNTIPLLYKGKYSMILYVRVGNKLGYKPQGEIIANSIEYIESVSMNFEVPEDISYHRKP